eukprot:3563717-Pyramimonas_sp.AAC.1
MPLEATGRTQSPGHGCSSNPSLQAQTSPTLLDVGGNPGHRASRMTCERGDENNLPLACTYGPHIQSVAVRRSRGSMVVLSTRPLAPAEVPPAAASLPRSLAPPPAAMIETSLAAHMHVMIDIGRRPPPVPPPAAAALASLSSALVAGEASCSSVERCVQQLS